MLHKHFTRFWRRNSATTNPWQTRKRKLQTAGTRPVISKFTKVWMIGSFGKFVTKEARAFLQKSSVRGVCDSCWLASAATKPLGTWKATELESESPLLLLLSGEVTVNPSPNLTVCFSSAVRYDRTVCKAPFQGKLGWFLSEQLLIPMALLEATPNTAQLFISTITTWGLSMWDRKIQTFKFSLVKWVAGLFPNAWRPMDKMSSVQARRTD